MSPQPSHPIPRRCLPALAVLAALSCAPAARAQGGSWEIGYSFDAPSYQTNGLAWDGQALWHTNDNQPIAYRINPDGGAVLNTIGTQVREQGDAETAGGALWIVSENDHYLHKVDPSTGKTLDTIRVLGIPMSPPGTRNPIQVEGLAWDGRNLWVSGGTNHIVRIDLARGSQHMYIMPFEMGYLDGMAWAFDHLWVVTNNATIYELDPCTMGVLDWFAAPASVSAGPEGFAFDGENLWFADNDLDRIYKIILKDKILTKRAGMTAGCDEGILLKASTPTVSLAAVSRPARPRVSRFAVGFPTAKGGAADARGRTLRLPGARSAPALFPEAQ